MDVRYQEIAPKRSRNGKEYGSERMLVAEIQELDEVKGLVVKGQQDGVISYGEVATAVSEVDLDESDIEELYAYLERQGVELVEDVDPAQASAHAAEAESDKRG
jgi:RNA polymerase primary sigma factor